MLGGLGVPELVIIFIVVALPAFNIWMLVMAAMKPNEQYPKGNKVSWIIWLAVSLFFIPLSLPFPLYFYFKVLKAKTDAQSIAPVDNTKQNTA